MPEAGLASVMLMARGRRVAAPTQQHVCLLTPHAAGVSRGQQVCCCIASPRLPSSVLVQPRADDIVNPSATDVPERRRVLRSARGSFTILPLTGLVFNIPQERAPALTIQTRRDTRRTLADGKTHAPLRSVHST
ncbi:hypothetical protein OPT61_g8968 [Boeremia exigua]|uniref:Uncharacterized protein n=1 Tax=Boeremia exigua TaxID=749465 RepID=A0ACC2HWA2_9PLEO|nr:hypothetical protein OPT61_g8968 [Boeremia exigua]